MFKDSRGKGFYDVLPVKEGQVNITITYPGVVRAFHRHKNQNDVWFLVSGEIEVVLYNEKEKSEEDDFQVKYLSGFDPPLLIEKNVWHGFRVLGNKPAILLYYVTEKYNSEKPDEERAPWDEFYDWVTEFK